MARCDQGYLCEVCGEEVERLIDSSLYLQYVLGWVAAEALPQHAEVHLRCNPNLAQFIDSPEFEPVLVDGPFDRRQLDAEFARQRAELITGGYQRLRQLQRDRSLTIDRYPIQPAADDSL
jgi:hypothetical protein